MSSNTNLKERHKDMEAALKELNEDLHEMLRLFWLVKINCLVGTLNRTLQAALIKSAITNCKNETVLRWLRENSETKTFDQLVDMFIFLKKHIDEEEKKNHSNTVDITFLAHGAIRDSMIPASCLLPLSNITDVLLYSPWNCTTDVLVVYGVATGLMKPEHRVFKCRKDEKSCQIPDEKHRPTKLPNHWNSIKKAGDQMIPNITLSPLDPQENGWEGFQTLTEKYGQLERNRIIIPYILPAGSGSSQSVPFSVVILALSLVLLNSRFKATVHLTACLSDQSDGQKFDKEYLKTQYACTIDKTTMTCSPDMFPSTLRLLFKRWFG